MESSLFKVLYEYLKTIFWLGLVSLIGISNPVLADTVNYIETQVNGQNNVAGLSGISDVAVSPDGKFVYTSSYASSAVSVFERDLLSGQLTYRSTMTGATAAFSVDVSSDGKSVYAASPTGGKIFAYSRNVETGALTAVSNVGTNGGTAGFVSVSVSPDSKHVYGVGGSPSGLVVFERDQDTGDLTVLFDYKDNVDGHELGQQYGPTISPIKNIVTSADGQFVYVTSTADNAVTLFSRNATTGALTQVAVYKDGTNGVDGIQAASSAKRSSDGKHLYVTGQGENSVAVFSIDSTTGELTYLDKMTNGAGGIEKLAGARSLAVSPDGRYVMVSAITANALTIFSRNASTGLLTLDSVVNNNENGVTGLSGPSGMSTDSLNRHLYVAGQSANSLVVFSLPTPAVSLTTTTATAEVSGSAVTLDNALSIFDSDSTHLISANVSITSGFISTDILAVQTVAGISASYDSAVGVLSLSGNAALADYQTVLRSLSYQAGADNSLAVGESSSRNIAFSVTDTDNNTSAPAVITVTVEKIAITSATLSFDSQGGNAIASVVVAIGSDYVLPAAPERIGYTFSSWNTSADGSGATYNAGSSFVMPATDLILYAQWTINQYTLTFDSAGGSAVAPITANFGSTITMPVAPVQVGYTFVGWSPVVPTTMPAANITVAAQWTVNQYTVTFDSAGGTTVAPLTQDFGSAVTTPAAPTREGYTFVGWNPVVPTTMPAANITVAAQWTVNQYTVTFDSAGGSAVASISANFGSAITAPAAPTREGYTFAGWNPVVPTTMPAANITVAAQWTVNQYTLTFDSAGGTTVAPLTQDFGSAVTTPAAPTREGYTFAGWSPVVPTTMPAANMTVAAQWTVNQYTLTFDSAGGTTVAPLTQDFGSAVTTPAAPTREGYTFVGWNPVVPTTMPAANITVAAQWTVNQYTVTFDSAGGSAVASISANFGSAITAPAAPTREGYTFAGWNPVVPTTMPAANMTVAAQWTVNQYTLTFDSAGGTTVAPLTQDFGSAVTTPAAPTREGYTFVGWNPAVPATMPAQNATLTAQWELNEVTVSAEVIGKGSISPASQQVLIGNTASFELTLENDQYARVEGNCSAQLIGRIINTVPITEACHIVVRVYDAVKVEADNEQPASGNETRYLRIIGSAGEVAVQSVYQVRADGDAWLDESQIATVLTRQPDGSYVFSAERTGRYVIQLLDAVSGEIVEVIFEVWPYVAFTSSQQPVQAGTDAHVRVWLSDEPVDYPVIVRYSTTQSGSEGALLRFTADNKRHLSLNTTPVTASANLTLTSADLGGALLGTPSTHRLNVQAAAVPLSLQASISQDGEEGHVVSTNAGLVTVTVSELNASPAVYQWHPQSELNLTITGGQASFDPATLEQGRYVIVTDAIVDTGTAQERNGQLTITLYVINSCPIGDCSNTGVSGIPASVNPHAQQPNRLSLCPAVSENNRVSACEVAENTQLYGEVPSTYTLTLGSLTEDLSWAVGQFGLAVNEQTLTTPGYTTTGFTVNFDIHGLQVPGEAVPVAIPLPAGTVIPANAVWRKYINGQWQNFVEDERNTLASAPLNALQRCPVVSSDVWTAGLTAGHSCIRLTIEDGGPNDDDGIANNVIRDPGVLAVAQSFTLSFDSNGGSVVASVTQLVGSVITPPVVPTRAGYTFAGWSPALPGTMPAQNISVTAQWYVSEATVTSKKGGSTGWWALAALALLAVCRKKLWLVMLLPVASFADAAGWQVQLQGGVVKSQGSIQRKAEQALPGAEVQVTDNRDAAWRLSLDYRLSERWSLSAAWVDLGEARLHYQQLPQGTTPETLAGLQPSRGQGPELSASVFFRPEAKIQPFLRAGVLYHRSQYDGQTAEGQWRHKDSRRLTPALQAGLVSALDANWQLSLSAVHYHTPRYRTQGVMLGIGYLF